jgi:uncharacterized protein (TIGR02231 family)
MRFFSILFLSLALFSLSAQSEILNSKITQVTVFSQGAQVLRQAQSQLSAGNHTLVFTHLTQHLQNQSIQLKADGDITVLSVSTQRNFLGDDDKNPTMLSLERQIESLAIELENIQAKASSLELEREVLEANKALGGTRGYTTTELQNTVRYMREQRQANAENWYALVRVQKEKQQEKQKLERQLQEEKNAFSQKTNQVVVKLAANSNTTANFELNYLVNNASWSSNYDVRVLDLQQPVELTHKAQIEQRTGEDWSKVKLRLATGNPSAGAQLPEVRPWYVAKLNTTQYIDGVTVRDNVNFDSNKDESAPTAKRMASNLNVTRQENLTQQEYTVDRLFSLPSSGSAKTVILRKLDLLAIYGYQIAPRQDKDAFLTAKVYDWGRYNLLNGPLYLYNNSTYVGQAYLNTQLAQDTLLLSLGRDKGIVVKRERVYANTEKAFLGSDRIDSYTWKIDIRNTKPTAVNITLKDQIPVSQNEEVTVKIENLGDAQLDVTTGILTWRLSLKPQESSSKHFSYKVRYPKAAQVRYY